MFQAQFDTDLVVPSTSNKIVRCTCSPRVCLFCIRFEQCCEWPTRKRFVIFVHRRTTFDNNVVLLLKVRAKPDEPHIDKVWDDMIRINVLECLHLEHLMWQMSTMGGALSAMGDFIEEFADKALKVSLRQREIAMRLGSPFLVCRCNMYIAIAMAQKRHFSMALQIIKNEYRNGCLMKSEFLKSCAMGLWSKVSYMRAKWLEERRDIGGRSDGNRMIKKFGKLGRKE